MCIDGCEINISNGGDFGTGYLAALIIFVLQEIKSLKTGGKEEKWKCLISFWAI